MKTDDTHETQAEDVLSVTNGRQRLAIVEKRKAPLTYALLLEQYHDWAAGRGNGLGADMVLQVHDAGDGPEFLVAASTFVVEQYLALLAARYEYTRRDFQIAVGLLIGYPVANCIEFADNPPDCECAKCGGPYVDSGKYQYADGVCLGKLIEPNPRAIDGNPALQPWSRGDLAPVYEAASVAENPPAYKPNPAVGYDS